jgi:cytochrome b561
MRLGSGRQQVFSLHATLGTWIVLLPVVRMGAREDAYSAPEAHVQHRVQPRSLTVGLGPAALCLKLVFF